MSHSGIYCAQRASLLRFKSISISCISVMNSYSTIKVCKCSIYLTICYILQFCTIASAGLFSERTVYIPSFKYEMCDHDYYRGRYGLWLKDLDIMATTYGDVDITGTFVTTRNLTSPVKATVNLKRKLFGLNIKIPCIKNFGSCTYNDICSFGYAENEQCPPLLEEYDVPCRCPIEPGVYNIPGVQIKEMARSRWASLLAGKYNAMIKFYQGGKILTCYRIYFTLA